MELSCHLQLLLKDVSALIARQPFKRTLV